MPIWPATLTPPSLVWQRRRRRPDTTDLLLGLVRSLSQCSAEANLFEAPTHMHGSRLALINSSWPPVLAPGKALVSTRGAQ